MDAAGTATALPRTAGRCFGNARGSRPALEDVGA
jgi:hypothetical protein